MKISLISPAELPKIWEHILPLLEKVIVAHPHGSYTLNGIYTHIHNKTMSLWVVYDGDPTNVFAVAATSVHLDMMGDRVCRIHFLGGKNIELWGHLWEKFEQYAADNGVKKIEVMGRRGLQKFLSDYDMTYQVFTKDLTKSDVTQCDLLENIQPRGTA